METANSPFQLLLITGISGSGKSTAAHVIEDLGDHVVDNLPLALLERVLLDPQSVFREQKCASVVADVRIPGFGKLGPQMIFEVDRERVSLTILFLEASDEVLQRRFRESRRPHPLGADGSLGEAIALERKQLAEIRAMADVIVDTSIGTVHDLRERIVLLFGDRDRRGFHHHLILESFGFKYGAPVDVDLLFDVRFLPNPYFRPELRSLSGKDREVRDFFYAEREFREVVDRLAGFLQDWVTRLFREGRRFLTVGIGCTGGRHRSVAIVEDLRETLSGSPWRVTSVHRDIARES